MGIVAYISGLQSAMCVSRGGRTSEQAQRNVNNMSVTVAMLGTKLIDISDERQDRLSRTWRKYDNDYFKFGIS